MSLEEKNVAMLEDQKEIRLLQPGRARLVIQSQSLGPEIESIPFNSGWEAR